MSERPSEPVRGELFTAENRTSTPWWPCCEHCSNERFPNGNGLGHSEPCDECQKPRDVIDHV